MKYYMGIDLGGTNIAAGIVDEEYKIVRKDSVSTRTDLGPDKLLDDMGGLCKGLIEAEGLSVDDFISAGIATPGTANHDTGEVVYANNLPFLHYPLADELKKRVPFKAVYIENDANAAALGEALAGAAKGASSSVMITLGTGVGGGYILDGKVVSGFNYAGAELGHTVIVYGGRQCSCGRKGCWEAYSSATGLINMTREKMNACPDSKMWDMCCGSLDKVTGRTAFEACRAGDKAGEEVVNDYINYLACGITNMINVFSPEVLSIGGGISNEKDYLLERLLPAIAAEQYAKNSENITKVKIAELRNDAGIVGAAVLGKR